MSLSVFILIYCLSLPLCSPHGFTVDHTWHACAHIYDVRDSPASPDVSTQYPDRAIRYRYLTLHTILQERVVCHSLANLYSGSILTIILFLQRVTKQSWLYQWLLEQFPIAFNNLKIKCVYLWFAVITKLCVSGWFLLIYYVLHFITVFFLLLRYHFVNRILFIHELIYLILFIHEFAHGKATDAKVLTTRW